MARTLDAAQDAKRQCVEALLWDWAEQGARGRDLSGHPSVSPTYRMMMEGGGSGGTRAVVRSGCSQWRGRTHRNKQGLHVKPSQTCYGRDTAAMRRPWMTKPESDADQAGPVTAVDNIIRGMLTETQQQIIVARYVSRIRQMQEIAAHLEMDRKVVSAIHKMTLEQIYKMMFDVAPRAERGVPA